MSLIKNGTEITRVWLSDGDKDITIDRAYAIPIIELEHNKIHNGVSYFIASHFDLPNGSIRNFIFKTPNIADRIHLTIGVDFEKESTLELTEGVSTEVDGTPITSFNRDRNSDNTSSLVVTHTPTNPTGGTLIVDNHRGDGNKIGGSVRGSFELILKQNTKYLLYIKNESALIGLTNWNFDWYHETG